MKTLQTVPKTSQSAAAFPALALTSLLAIVPLLKNGPSCGHDFDFHIVSWLEASTQIAHFGYPHWAYTPAFNAGEPRFLFYPPLSWLLGGLLGLVLPWNFVPIAFTWIALTLSGLTMHALARRYASPPAALLAATLYLANPYMLFNAYERTAYGELLAAAWLPLLFAAILPTPHPASCPNPTTPARDPALRILPIACALALLWLSNAPAAVMGSYTLAFLTLSRLLLASPLPNSRHSDPERSEGEEPQYLCSSNAPRNARLHLALTATAGTLLGLALAAFYIVPAAYQQRFVQVNMAVIPGMRPADHFLFHKMPGDTFDDRFHDLVVRTASLTSLTLLAAIAFTLFFAFFQSGKKLRHPDPESSEGEEPPRLPSSKKPQHLPPSENIRLSDRNARHLDESARHSERSEEPPHLPSSKEPQHPPPSANAHHAEPSADSPLLPLAALTLLIAFLLTPPSLVLWNHLPKLAFLQFPWRLTAILAVILATLAAISLCRLKIRPLSAALASLLLAAALVLPAWHAYRQRCFPEDSVLARVALFHSNLGTEATDEYTPTGADGDDLQPGDPPYWLLPASADPDAPAPPRLIPGPAPTHLQLTLATPTYLVLDLRQYPSWHARLNGQPLAPIPHKRRDGLVTYLLPPGHDTLDLAFLRTPDQNLGLGLTLCACLTAFFLSKRNPSARSQPK